LKKAIRARSEIDRVAMVLSELRSLGWGRDAQREGGMTYL
jgi:hypothetical protein